VVGTSTCPNATILTTRGKDNLNSVAEQTDRIHEIGHKTVVVATTVLQTTRAPNKEEQP